ncbi:putative L-malate dehydrogenase [Kockovaella imperatae]|uniref:malate dehydrogenase n=1 Tax=Kockovaella imperatae TaxID=4999 RepID=A0A1Y1UKS8_9TREE|nr:putative L-malate dehydrogenase [Kockovaella imperatae]ORX37735.1 putative L-malate dehydrogenase [Kockovaella imperatae]
MVKACVCGAAGGIGQPLSLLLKLNPLVTELSLYDVVNALGVAADLSHIASPAQVTGYLPPDNGAEKALKDSDIVIIPAGVPRKPGMTRDDLFINAGICATLAQSIAKACPKAFILVISNPVNSTVPIFAEVLKKAGVYDPKRLLGVSHLDIVRASTFVASVVGKPADAAKYVVPVLGGHSGATILPLLSQSQPSIPSEILNDKEKRDALVNRIQFGGDEVVKAKDGAGSATLSMAQAGAEFAEYVLKAAFGGEKVRTVQAYIDLGADAGGAAVQKEIGADLSFFSVNIQLGPGGVEKILPVGDLDDSEKTLLEAAVKELGPSIEKGVSFQPAPPKL